MKRKRFSVEQIVGVLKQAEVCVFRTFESTFTGCLITANERVVPSCTVIARTIAEISRRHLTDAAV